MERTLYHGSQIILEKPEYGKGARNNDYGRGFYCTEEIELAREWANVPLVPCGRHKGVVIIAAAAGLIDTLHLALSRYFLGVFVSCAAPLPVPRCRSRRDRLRNGGSVIVVFL